MMIKYYCDRCGVEIKKGFNKPTKYSYLILKTPIAPLFPGDVLENDNYYEDKIESTSERFHLCDCCTDLLDDFFNKKAIKGLE